MRRIIIHWTGGGWFPNITDKEHYHFLIDRNGKVINGKYKVEMKDLSGEYNLSPWMDNSDIAVIMKILDSLNDMDSLKSVSKDESGEIFKGVAENIEYEIKLSSKNNIISIFVPKIGLKANFTDNR